MRKWFVGICLLCINSISVSALEFTAPGAPGSAQPYMPEAEETFAQGIWYIIKTAAGKVMPELADASVICLSLVLIVMLLSILQSINKNCGLTTRLTGAVVIGALIFEPMHTMIRLGTDTIQQICDYSKLLLPVMTSALAAQGGTTMSSSLYVGTAIFNALLTTIITHFVVPALYIYLCLCIATAALDQELLKKIRDFIKWSITWLMKWTLYIFTGYISITGVISGTVDASVLKATKIGISNAVPVVGSILSDATDTILVSAGLMKNSAGIYGVFAVLAICVEPFITIGVQYLLLKFAAGIADTFNYKSASSLIHDFSTGMGFVLAMTGTVCVMLLVSLVCFMKGLG